MTNYWIFVVTDAKLGSRKKKGIEIYNQRMSDSFWGIGEGTPNRTKLKKGDKAVFYLGGSEGQKFLGTCTLASDYYKLGKKEWEKLKRGPFFQATQGVKLADTNVWDTPRPIQPLIESLGFIAKPEFWGTYLQGGVRSISEDDYNLIVSGKPSVGEEIKNVTEFVLEKYLKEFIVSNWKRINFGARLELYKDEDGNTGENYSTPVGYPDLLCVDKDTKDLVVIELKKGRESDKVVGQTLRYMGWVKENLAKTRQNVRGIIVTKERDEKLTYAIKPVKDKIRVKYYDIAFKLVD